MGKLNFYFYTLRCKQIHIGEFILGILKVFYLDNALVYKGIDDKIYLTEANFQSLGKSALGYLGIAFYLLKDMEGFFGIKDFD